MESPSTRIKNVAAGWGMRASSKFGVLQVIEVRPPETMERIEEMVRAGLERERVTRAWG